MDAPPTTRPARVFARSSECLALGRYRSRVCTGVYRLSTRTRITLNVDLAISTASGPVRISFPRDFPMWLVSAKHCHWEPLWYLERCRNPGRSVLINPNISRRVGRPLQRARACAVSTAVVRGSRGPRAVSKFHLCVRRSGVFGVEMKTLPCYACECGSHRYLSNPRERVLGTCVRPGVAEPDCEPVEG